MSMSNFIEIKIGVSDYRKCIGQSTTPSVSF